MKHSLKVDSVVLEFGLKKILQNVYLKNETVIITGLLGRNGSGKSCLMKIIFGELKPLSKSVRIDEVSLLGKQMSSTEIKYLPQNNFIPKSLSIARIFRGCELDWERFVYEFPSFKSKKRKRIRNLSSGERRIVEIYSMIASKTKFCLLDEPFSQVMPIHVETLKRIMLREKANKGIVIADHLYREVLDVCDDLYVIVNGTTYLTKSAEDLEALGYIRGGFVG